MQAKQITHAKALEALHAHPAAQTDDIQYCINPDNKTHGWDKGTHDYALTLGADIEAQFKLPQKAVKRFTQFVRALQAGIPERFDYTHARVLLAMRAAGTYKLTRDAVVTLAANKIAPGVETRGVTRGQINTLFKYAHGLKTVESKVSNSTGANGFYQTLGITHGVPKTKNREFTLSASHPMLTRFYEIFDGATEGQLQALADKGEKKGKGK